ncbi:MAG: hypothetical protein ACLTHS_02985 [Eubacterium sp.]
MRKKWIAIFMTLCLLLSGCQGNVKETEQKEDRQETAENTKAPECEYTWATSHCTYHIEMSSLVYVPENSDDEYEFFSQECLVQSDYQGKELQRIPADQLGITDGVDITFLHVSEKEVLICWNTYAGDESKAHIYSVPVIWKDGSEEIAVEKKQLLFEADSDFTPEYVADTKECILLNFDNKLEEYDRKNNKLTQIKYENKPLKYSHILYENNMDSFVFFAVQGRKSAAYHYNCETKKVREIIKDERSMLYQGGEDKLFYTAVKEENGVLCYDVYQYDCKTREKSVFLTEEQIRNALTEKPEEGMDLIREMAFEDGKLKLEINVKGKGVLLNCDMQTGEPVQEGEGKIQKAQEYLLEKPLTNADKKYTNANDHNVFIQTIENDTNYSVDEYTLDGKFVRHIFTNNFHCAKPWMLYYANNQELIFGDGEQAYTVPLVLKNGNSFPQPEKAEKICDANISVYESNLYADENYLVYNTVSNCYCVYDRKNKEFVKKKGIPERNVYLLSRVGNCFVFDSTIDGKEGEFLYDRRGDVRICIANWAADTAVKIGDEKRNQVIYTTDRGIWTYDLKKNKKERLAKWNKHDSISEMFIWKDQLFMLTSGNQSLYSCSLDEKGKLHYEEEFTKAVKKYEQESQLEIDIETVRVVEDKIGIYAGLWSAEGEEIEEDTYFCYDLVTKQLKKEEKNDPEMFYRYIKNSK